MCVVAAKFIKNIGWVGVKNRDRNYKPIISFIQSHKGGIERLMLRDDITGYTEGINEFGVSVLSAATAVKSDEKEAVLLLRKKKKGAKRSLAAEVRAGNIEVAGENVDGKKLGKVLLEPTLDKALVKIKELHPLGNHILFDESTCYMVEIDLAKAERERAVKQREIDPNWEHPDPESRDVDISVKKVPKDSHVIRTNHGIMIDTAGYQTEVDSMNGDTDNNEYLEWMQQNRLSSDSRYKVAERGVKKADSIFSMLEALSDRSNKDPQMNPLRTGSRTEKKALRTTGQMVIIPSMKKIQYRNIWSTVKEGRFNKANKNSSVTYLDLLSYTEDIYESKFNTLVQNIILN